jgi:hypothetical protein
MKIIWSLTCYVILYTDMDGKVHLELDTVKLDIKELLNKEQIGFKELFTDYQPFYTINLLLNKELLKIICSLTCYFILYTDMDGKVHSELGIILHNDHYIFKGQEISEVFFVFNNSK